jgi:hypothetical protein
MTNENAVAFVIRHSDIFLYVLVTKKNVQAAPMAVQK